MIRNTIAQISMRQEKPWGLLEKSIIYYQGRPIGTVAAQDLEVAALNYDQCFIRDFVPAALLFLMHGRTEIVRNFLTETLAMQSHNKELDCFAPGPGLMPASFKVEHDGEREFIEADFGESAIALATPRLIEDRFPEYYDGKQGRLIGRAARIYQTWTLAGLLAAKEIMANPKHVELFSFEEEINSSGKPLNL